MERDAHYAAVGIVTVALLVALAVFTIWLARLQFNEDYDVYDIIFYGPVRGLSEGGEVYFNGIRVGEVTKLNLNPERANQVVARVRVNGTTPVRVTSRAQLEPQGITGLNYIQITAGSTETPLLKSQHADNVVPVIQSQASPLAELLTGSGTVLQQTVDALNRINRVLSDDNIRSFSSSIRNVEEMTAELNARKGMLLELEQTLKNANAAVAEYQGLAADTRQIINTDGRAAIANIAKASEEARTAIASINRSASSLEEPLGEFGTTTVPQINDAVRQLNQATRALEDMIDNVRQSPREFIGRPTAKELEVQP
ncbi:MlaD family protein [Brevundimonas terrae]|uniref:MlaD family protein n=1 Tax=Brevundimonas terrae TaxID=363631 RepID=A0ABN0YCY2_9CAUL|nr:MlaD family protein [Brevundimonas terrae]NIJ26493.1 phospholipid/cholesterol/gamma-HCH transport system substrate-binding protein [Brevundimonas terrae]